ncbi:MAG: AgmX/PglI C-terminal domain-containing protein [Halobacteriovoraceae bacterium]|nr:AgmX/PglI C-terminal domain-containing protein [Halobacteriovoraceae bacterium]
MKTFILCIFAAFLISCSHTETEQWMNDVRWEVPQEELSKIDYFLDTAYFYEVVEADKNDVGQSDRDSNYLQFESEHPKKLRKVERNTPLTTSEIVHRILASHSSNLNQCISYDQNSKSRSKVTFVFTIRPDGKIQRVGIGESTLDMGAKACMIEKLYELQFPKNMANRNIRVNQPIIF